MSRKKWEAKTNITPALIKTREKRKWQIALRRYVLEKNICLEYAPYFGLGIVEMRKWFENQFREGTGWHNFGEHWQFGHVLPLSCFDFSREEELRMCWNFVNLRVETLESDHEKGGGKEILAAKTFFNRLMNETGYQICSQLLEKISRMEKVDEVLIQAQTAFFRENNELLQALRDFGTYEYEQLNRGRSMREVKEESDFLRKFR